MPPANDNFANAEVLSGASGTTSGTTLDATFEGTEVEFWDNDQSVWYKFTPAASGRYRFDVVNSSLVYVGTGVPEDGSVALTLFKASGVSLATCDFNNAFTVFSSTFTDPDEDDYPRNAIAIGDLVSGTTYYMKVYSPEGTYNRFVVDFDLTWDEVDTSGSPPANDDIANPEDLGNDPQGVFPGSTIFATWEAFEEADFYIVPSVWYKFSITTPATQAVTLTAQETLPDWKPYAEIWTVLSDPPADFTDLDFYESLGNDVQTLTESSTNVSFVPGDYVLIVYNWYFDYTWDDFELEFEEFDAPPDNDNFNNATELSYKYSICATGTTAGATIQDPDEPDTNPGSIDPPHPSVWYEYTPPNYINQPLDIQFDTEDSDADTFLEVFTGNSLGSLTLIDSDHNSGPGGSSLVTINSNGDVDYKIRVSSPTGSQGNFNLNINIIPGGSPPANDNWANAELMTGFSDTVSGTTVGATGQCAEPDWGFGSYGTNSVWYKWVPPRTGRVRIDLEGSGPDGVSVFVARGTTLAGLQEVDDISPFSNGDLEYDFFSAEAGIDYYFAVMGDGGAEETFDLSILMADADPPANDLPANAETLTPGSGTINPVTTGANWDTTEPFLGNFITFANENITVWYTFVSPDSGNVTFTFNSETDVYPDSSFDGNINFYEGESPASLVSVAQNIRPTGAPFSTDTRTIDVIAGRRYYIAVSSYGWMTATDIDYSFALQDEEHGGVSTNPGSGTTDDFDSVTGNFDADEEDGVYVASGGIGYGTLEPFDNGHYPYGWWARFEVQSTSGEYLYRYGQTQQFIEFFRATKSGSGDYASLYLLGHENGTQSIAVRNTSGTVSDLDYKVWGINAQGTTGKVRIEVGANGVTIDGKRYTSGVFTDSVGAQFDTFDIGIITYPGDGTAYVDLDPEWDIRISDYRIHDNPEECVMGPADPTNKEITLFAGWTTGELLVDDNTIYPELIMSESNIPDVIPSVGDMDGFSLDCTVDTSNVFPCGINWFPSMGSIYFNPFADAPSDSYFPGISFRFLVTEFPSQDMSFALIGDEDDYCRIYIGPTGILSVQPSVHSELIPFCTVNEDEYNYMEFQVETETQYYKTKIWLQEYPMGTFTTTNTNLSLVQLGPRMWNHFAIGRLGTTSIKFGGDVEMGIHFRDVAMTRCRHHRKIGNAIVIQKEIIEDGAHNYAPSIYEADATDFAVNGDFSGGTDTPGQPLPWTAYDRGDTAPAGATKGGFLFESWGTSTITVTTDGSGPPGFEGDNAMSIAYAGSSPMDAAYVFDDGMGNLGSGSLEIDFADNVCAHFYMKGPAGHRVALDVETNLGDISGFNQFPLSGPLTGGWDEVKIWMPPVPSPLGSLFLHAIILHFLDGTTGSTYLVKDFKLYVNPAFNKPIFFKTDDDGATVLEIEEGEDETHEIINDFPSDDDSHIYMNTETLKYFVRGNESDGKTHLPPMWGDQYLEYILDDVDQEEDGDGQIFSARMLVQLKGYHGLNRHDVVDFENYALSGHTRFTIAKEDGTYRYAGQHASRIHSSDVESSKYAIQLCRPVGHIQWGLNEWNDLRLRVGFHDVVFESSLEIVSNNGNAGVLQGATMELLIQAGRLPPPHCIRPVDLIRVRFRAYETNDID